MWKIERDDTRGLHFLANVEQFSRREVDRPRVALGTRYNARNAHTPMTHARAEATNHILRQHVHAACIVSLRMSLKL